MPFPIEFDLPSRLIAQEPCVQRDQSRLMVVRRDVESIEHRPFSELPEILSPGDLLIVNDTRVLPARLLGQRQTGGSWEGLYVKTLADGSWEMLCRGRLHPGETVLVNKEGAALFSLRLEARLGPGRWRATPLQPGDAASLLEKYGHVPLPPYIRKGRDTPADRKRYQTVFASEAGAIAAPTAGLHFTPELLQRLNERGIEREHVTLHVGLGTFLPIKVNDYTRHEMHREWGQLCQSTVAAIERCRARKGKVVAVGTTTVRVLESVAACGPIRPWSGETGLFIYPPYRFAATDVLITNFHLPHSTLLLLVGAFAGVALLEKAYKMAIAQEYRFFSYGDAMIVL